jgi:hypothetical protein
MLCFRPLLLEAPYHLGERGTYKTLRTAFGCDLHRIGQLNVHT